MTDKVVPIRGNELRAEVGGPVDEFRVTLAIYGETLDPRDITKLVGLEPTQSHMKGFQRRPASVPAPTGGWFLTVEGHAPASPSDAIESLLRRLPVEKEFWESLTSSYEVQLRVAMHTSGMNRGFEITPAAADRVAATGIGLDFDLYFYGEDDHHV